MANLPRWIDDPGVDSMAMLGAFLGWVYKASPEEQQEVQHLYTIEHAMVAAGQVLQPSHFLRLSKPSGPLKE